MKLRQKLLLAVLPAMLAGTMLLGGLTYIRSHDLILGYEQEQLRLNVDYIVSHVLANRQGILERTKTESVPSFVERYQDEALGEIDELAGEIDRRITVFDQESGLAVHRADPKASATAVPQEAPPWVPATQDGASDELSQVGRSDDGKMLYAVAGFTPWNWIIVLSVEESEILEPLSGIRSATILVALISTAIAALVFNMISKRAIIRPIQELQRATGLIARHEKVDHLRIDSRDEIGELAGDLKRMSEEIVLYVDKANAAAKAKSDFLATMSHEIRTPMNGVMGMAQLLSLTEQDQTQRRYTNVILESGQQLKRIIDDILDISKLDAGQVSLEELPVDLSGIVRKTAALFSAAAESRSNALLVELEPEREVWVKADATRLQQCLDNLVSNAIKFTENGQVTVAMAVRDGADGRVAVELSVTDSGIGIPEAARASLFDRFTQSDSSTTRRFGGTGLGLAIVQQLVSLMGGEIRLESEVGKGTSLRLLLAFEPAAAGERPDSQPSKKRAPDLRGRRILVAEDNAINQLLVRSLLDNTAVETTLVENGIQAFEAARDQSFDLILMDIQMPELDGIGATRRIRALPGLNGQVPIIALTANVMPGDRELYLSEQMDAHIAKPLDVETLYRTLERFLCPEPSCAPLKIPA